MCNKRQVFSRRRHILNNKNDPNPEVLRAYKRFYGVLDEVGIWQHSQCGVVGAPHGEEAL